MRLAAMLLEVVLLLVGHAFAVTTIKLAAILPRIQHFYPEQISPWICSTRGASYVWASSTGGVLSQAIAEGLAAIEGNYSAVVGEFNSATTELLAYTMAAANIPLCSGGSSSPALSSKTSFPTFFRTIPSDNLQTLVMLLFVQSQGWARVAIFASNSAYAQGLADALYATASGFGVEVLVSLEVNVADPVDLSLKGPRGSVIRPEDNIQQSLCLTINSYPICPGSVLSDTPALSAADLSNLEGLIVTSPLGPSADWEAIYQAEYGRPPQERITPTITYPTHQPPARSQYDAVFAVAYGLQHMMQAYGLSANDIAINKWQMEMKPTIGQFTNYSAFAGSTGTIEFNANGDRVSAFYGIYNVQTNGSSPAMNIIGTSDTSTIKLASPPVFYSGLSTPPADVPVFTWDVVGYNQAAAAFLTAWAALYLAILGLSLPFLLIYRDHPAFKPVSPPFMAVTAFGMMLILATIFIDAKQWQTEGSLLAGMVSRGRRVALACCEFRLLTNSVVVEVNRHRDF
ncbi:periplasmic binding protein-like I [Blyttiomyces helicus]|uniref:Periplasmic binding protein-like I n=1 Tax=Blyttiomyces helicus TaxID=388810 RepID=A0A4P9W5Q8_9FUNG|nr:periplasmic binding protein-like I [Blyttiomyces helicus]|eukprot:RKO85436.1 periplasmic binding protein-like I [Blyttiomyces helicus]